MAVRRTTITDRVSTLVVALSVVALILGFGITVFYLNPLDPTTEPVAPAETSQSSERVVPDQQSYRAAVRHIWRAWAEAAAADDLTSSSGRAQAELLALTVPADERAAHLDLVLAFDRLHQVVEPEGSPALVTVSALPDRYPWLTFEESD